VKENKLEDVARICRDLKARLDRIEAHATGDYHAYNSFEAVSRKLGELERQRRTARRWLFRGTLVVVAMLGIGAVILAMSVGSILLLASGFLPAQDTERSLLSIELPPGSRLSDTEDVTEDIVKLLRTRPEITTVFVNGGRLPQGSMEVRKASIIIQYTPKAKRSITQKDMELFITRKLEDIPDIHHWFVDENGLRAIWSQSHLARSILCGPICTSAPRTVMPGKILRATAPAATRMAVSRAEERPPPR